MTQRITHQRLRSDRRTEYFDSFIGRWVVMAYLPHEDAPTEPIHVVCRGDDPPPSQGDSK